MRRASRASLAGRHAPPAETPVARHVGGRESLPDRQMGNRPSGSLTPSQDRSPAPRSLGRRTPLSRLRAPRLRYEPLRAAPASSTDAHSSDAVKPVKAPRSREHPPHVTRRRRSAPGAPHHREGACDGRRDTTASQATWASAFVIGRPFFRSIMIVTLKLVVASADGSVVAVYRQRINPKYVHGPFGPVCFRQGNSELGHGAERFVTD